MEGWEKAKKPWRGLSKEKKILNAKDARIAALEAECERLRAERHQAIAASREWIKRGQSAETALAAARAMLESWKDAADEDREALIDAGIEMTGHSIVYGIRKLAALRSLADDAGRVERARKAFPSGRIPDEWSIDEVIEAVLAAADGRNK